MRNRYILYAAHDGEDTVAVTAATAFLRLVLMVAAQ